MIEPSTESTEPAFVWSDAYLSGHRPTDDMHQEFVVLTHQLMTCAAGKVKGVLILLENHCVQHFALEKRQMEESQYPKLDCHVAEHEAVLRSVTEVRELSAAGGDIDVARRLAAELATWFEGHLAYLDSAMAHWLVKRRSGGIPVVLRRGMASGTSFQSS